MYWNNRIGAFGGYRAHGHDGMKKPDAISIMSNTRCAKVPIDDIEAIEQEGRRLHIITGMDDYICYERIDKVAPLLINRNFYRAMKSIIVNFDRVKEVTSQEVIFVSGQSMAMGKNNLSKLRKAYRSFLQSEGEYSNTVLYQAVAEKKEPLRVYKDDEA